MVDEFEELSEDELEQADQDTNESEIQEGVELLEKAKIFTPQELVDLENTEGLTKERIAQAMINQSVNLGAQDVGQVDWSKVSKAEILLLARQELKDMIDVSELRKEDLKQ